MTVVYGWLAGGEIPAEYRPALCELFGVSEPFLMGSRARKAPEAKDRVPET